MVGQTIGQATVLAHWAQKSQKVGAGDPPCPVGSAANDFPAVCVRCCIC